MIATFRTHKYRWALLMGIFYVLSGCIKFKDSPFSDELQSEARNLNLTMMARIQSMNLTEGFRVAFVSDSHQNYEDFKRVIHRLNTFGDVDFIILGGDFTNFSYGFEYDYALDVISESVHPVLTVIGNHDALGFGKELFKKAFGPWNYSLIVADTKFIFWNNNTLEFVEEGVDVDWLEREVATAPASTQTVIVQHIDVENEDYFTPDYRTNMRTMYAKYGVAAVLNGHLHQFFTYSVEATLVHQTSRIEAEKYSLIDFAKDSISVQVCQGEVCQRLD